MPVTFTETGLPGVLVVESPEFKDDRGFFTETYSQPDWAAAGFNETFVQDNLSMSRKGTVRGMHYQIEPHAMGKLVRTLTGCVFDVAVDLRKGSPTFGKWVGRTLSAENGLSLWIPPGFAHGFIALEEETLVHYKCTHVWTRDAERALFYKDPEVGIVWPTEPTHISPKDLSAPSLAEAEHNFVYRG